MWEESSFDPKKVYFFSIKTSLKLILKIIYKRSFGAKKVDMFEQLGVVSKAIDSVLKDVSEKLSSKKPDIIVSKNCVVEVAKTALTKQKNNWGRVVKTLWWAGGACRKHVEIFYELTKKRDNKKT
ncbi:hypothetical protein CDIK_4242 [Cucumispora dikerogammari]|nr:hypothetical protein CDIK_4242 [Cucumispora dikerogammari]